MNLIQSIATVGALGQVFLPDAFLARTLDKVPDFKIVFEIIFFLGHIWHPTFASLLYYFVFSKTDDILPFWKKLSPLVPGWDRTPL